MERLTEWRGEHAAIVNNHANYIDRLAAYEDAEEQGLLVRLPCRVGDTVYTESHIKGAITSFRAPDETWIFENRSEFGRSLFLTREEAEAALAKEG